MGKVLPEIISLTAPPFTYKTKKVFVFFLFGIKKVEGIRRTDIGLSCQKCKKLREKKDGRNMVRISITGKKKYE